MASLNPSSAYPLEISVEDARRLLAEQPSDVLLIDIATMAGAVCG